MSSVDGFPAKEPFARAFFQEATRHLEDAQILHKAARYPASITSSMKAAELGVKTILILDGALGWWDKLMTTHKPVEDITAHQILRHNLDKLNAKRPKIDVAVRKLEQLIPNQPGKQNFVKDNEANPEYPFVSAENDRLTGRDFIKTEEPRLYFTEARSKELYGIAREVFVAVQAAYPPVTEWQIVLPDAL